MVPVLPPEIWHHIFCFAAVCGDARQPGDFWVKGRQVCRQWREAIPNAYRETLLRNPDRCFIYFEFDAGGTYHTTFSHFDLDDKSRCIFKESESGLELLSEFAEDEDMDDPEHEWNEGMEWHFNGETMTDHEGKPFKIEQANDTPHLISIWGTSWDSALPGLRYNDKKPEVSFEWQGMLNRFFIETLELSRRDVLSAETIGALHRDEVNSKPEDHGPLMRAMQAFVNGTKKNIRDVRRERIERSVRESLGAMSYEERMRIIDQTVTEFGEEKVRIDRIHHGTGLAMDEDDSKADEAENTMDLLNLAEDLAELDEDMDDEADYSESEDGSEEVP